jgi:hypothetical protein
MRAAVPARAADPNSKETAPRKAATTVPTPAREPACQIRLQPVFEQTDDTGSCDRSLNGKIRCRPDTHQQRPGGFDAHHLTIELIFPGHHGTAGKLPAQASMLEQVAGMLRPAMFVEVGGSRRGRVALHSRTDRHGNHVLLEPLVVADARVKTGREDINEIFFGNHFHPDLRIGPEEGRNDSRQDQARGADGNIEPECARRSVAKPVDHIESRFHLGQRGAEALQQAFAGLCGYDTPC